MIKSSPSDVFVAELETTLIKWKRKMVEPIIFMLMDVPTNPVFCPILPLIALAFANDAFPMKGYERRRIYSDSELKTPIGII